jgi:hypothetical protein
MSTDPSAAVKFSQLRFSGNCACLLHVCAWCSIPRETGWFRLQYQVRVGLRYRSSSLIWP